MYVRMITYHLRQDVTKDTASSTYNDIVEHLSDERGFQGSALLLDEEAGTAISLTYWSDEECAGEAGTHLLPMLFERTGDLTDRAPEITGYHVLDHKMNGS